MRFKSIKVTSRFIAPKAMRIPISPVGNSRTAPDSESLHKCMQADQSATNKSRPSEINKPLEQAATLRAITTFLALNGENSGYSGSAEAEEVLERGLYRLDSGIRPRRGS